MARPNFFCGIEALRRLVKTELPDAGEEIDLTIDLIEAPYLLLYTTDEENWRLRVYSRGELYSHDESGIERGSLAVERASGHGSGTTTDKLLARNLGAFFNACRQLVKFIYAKELEPLYRDLDPERAGILLYVDENGELCYRVVAGADRPEMKCTTLQGSTAMCRPYADEVIPAPEDPETPEEPAAEGTEASEEQPAAAEEQPAVPAEPVPSEEPAAARTQEGENGSGETERPADRSARVDCFDQRLRFLLPEGYEAVRDLDDAGEARYRILFRPSLDENGERISSFAVTVRYQGQIVLKEEKQNLSGNLACKLSTETHERKGQGVRMKTSVLIEHDRHGYSFIVREAGKDKEDLFERAELVAEHLRAVLGSIELDGLRADFEPLDFEKLMGFKKPGQAEAPHEPQPVGTSRTPEEPTPGKTGQEGETPAEEPAPAGEEALAGTSGADAQKCAEPIVPGADPEREEAQERTESTATGETEAPAREDTETPTAETVPIPEPELKAEEAPQESATAPDGRSHASARMDYSDGETLHLPGYRLVLPRGARYKKGVDGRELIAWLPGEDPERYEGAPLVVLAGRESGSTAVTQMITAEEYGAFAREYALKEEASGRFEQFRRVDVLALEDRHLPGGAVCCFSDGAAYVRAFVALCDRVKRMEIQFNGLREGEEETVLNATREIFAHMTAVPPAQLLEDLDDERFLAAPLDERLAADWESNIEQRMLHLRSARLKIQRAMVGVIKARRQKGELDLDAVREQVLEMLRHFSGLTDRHLQKGAAAFRQIVAKAPDDPLLLRLRDALLDMGAFADQTVDVNGERLLVRSQVASQLRRELDLPELRELSSSRKEARDELLGQTRDLLAYYLGKRREEEEQSEQLRVEAARAARERERLELEDSVRVERERFEKSVKDWESQCKYVESRRKRVADERVSAQMQEARRKLLDDRDKELARLDEEEGRQKKIKADAETLLPTLSVFRVKEKREKQAEIANAESILAQIVKDRTSAKTRFAKSLRELSENETETRNRMLETVTQEMPLPERPREPEELLRAEQALREHRSEVVAELGQGADSATENALKAKILSHMEPDHAYDLDQMLTLMKGHPELSPLRLTALLAKMIRDGVLVRTVYKDKSFYSLA